MRKFYLTVAAAVVALFASASSADAGFTITLHETGNVAGFNPVLVMDVWEHAFILDYKPADRPKYIEAFFSNIDWSAVERRLRGQSAQSLAA